MTPTHTSGLVPLVTGVDGRSRDCRLHGLPVGEFGLGFLERCLSLIQRATDALLVVSFEVDTAEALTGVARLTGGADKVLVDESL